MGEEATLESTDSGGDAHDGRAKRGGKPAGVPWSPEETGVLEQYLAGRPRSESRAGLTRRQAGEAAALLLGRTVTSVLDKGRKLLTAAGEGPTSRVCVWRGRRQAPWDGKLRRAASAGPTPP
jgi:hypothetical protein